MCCVTDGRSGTSIQWKEFRYCVKPATDSGVRNGSKIFCGKKRVTSVWTQYTCVSEKHSDAADVIRAD